ncbi:MAG: hypothetical protein MOB07_13780 [Acidobacteria bacterium]|nr:hypothetical protein [Acidobacteriota bacterium]
MSNQHVMTLENPAGLLITPEILEQIGVSTGDRIEISVSEHALIVRPLTVAETERRTVDDMMESIMDRHDNLFRRLAEGAK